MPARFFVDENLLPIGRALAAVRPTDVVHPGHRDLPDVPLGTPDLDWIASISQRGLVAITRDKHIRTRPAERAAVLACDARIVWLSGKQDLRMFEQLAIVINSWPSLEAAASIPGPWVKALTAPAGLRDLRIRP